MGGSSLYIKQDNSDFGGRERNIKKSNRRESTKDNSTSDERDRNATKDTLAKNIQGVKGEQILKIRTIFYFEELARLWCVLLDYSLNLLKVRHQKYLGYGKAHCDSPQQSYIPAKENKFCRFNYRPKNFKSLLPTQHS